jgi:hypothetical protein
MDRLQDETPRLTGRQLDGAELRCCIGHRRRHLVAAAAAAGTWGGRSKRCGFPRQRRQLAYIPRAHPPPPCTSLRVRMEIMGSHICRIVGESQSVLVMIDPIIFTRTRIIMPRTEAACVLFIVWLFIIPNHSACVRAHLSRAGPRATRHRSGRARCPGRFHSVIS